MTKRAWGIVSVVGLVLAVGCGPDLDEELDDDTPVPTQDMGTGGEGDTSTGGEDLGVGGGGEDASTGGGGCGDDHPRVGQSLTFATRAHGVRGSARVVDNCTIVVESFDYDGGGVDSRFYGAKNSTWADGFALSENLVRPMAYRGETITLKVPVGKSLDDLDGLSVWCIPFAASFGDGQFE